MAVFKLQGGDGTVIVMNNLHTKSVVYIGLLTGLILSVICLLSPLAKGMVVWYQLMTVLASGVLIGYFFKNKMHQSYSISIYGMLYALALTRYSAFVDERSPILFAIFLSVVTTSLFLIGSKFFSLKMNKILQHAIAILGFLVLFFVIPVALLLVDRAT